jgi:hypothetical protein
MPHIFTNPQVKKTAKVDGAKHTQFKVRTVVGHHLNAYILFELLRKWCKMCCSVTAIQFDQLSFPTHWRICLQKFVLRLVSGDRLTPRRTLQCHGFQFVSGTLGMFEIIYSSIHWIANHTACLSIICHLSELVCSQYPCWRFQAMPLHFCKISALI